MIFRASPYCWGRKNVYSNAKSISYFEMVLIMKRTLSEMRNGLINRGYLELYFKFISKFPHVLKKGPWMKPWKKKFRMKKKSFWILIFCFSFICMLHLHIFICIIHLLRVYYLLTKWPAPRWLDSSVGTALHRYRRDHGFESRSGLNFFRL